MTIALGSADCLDGDKDFGAALIGLLRPLVTEPLTSSVAALATLVIPNAEPKLPVMLSVLSWTEVPLYFPISVSVSRLGNTIGASGTRI